MRVSFGKDFVEAISQSALTTFEHQDPNQLTETQKRALAIFAGVNYRVVTINGVPKIITDPCAFQWSDGMWRVFY